MRVREHNAGRGFTEVPSEQDEREFTRLYLESYGVVYNYVRRRMAGDAAAEDVVAEAYLLAARSFRRFDPTRAKFSTWVIHIANNCMASYYRREHPSVPLDELPERVFSVEDVQSEAEDKELVDQLLGVLDERERELVILKYCDDMRNVDIARELGMNASTVSTLLARAVAKMRRAVEGDI